MRTEYYKCNILTCIGNYNQWVAWRWGPPRENGKQPKVPINPHNGKQASATDDRTWASVSWASAAVDKYGCAGIGFVFSGDDPYTGVDLDNCVIDGEVAPWAMKIVEALDSYTEVSPSGTGLKVWVEASKPGDRCRTGDIEMYDSGRFFTFTGERFAGESVEKRQAELTELYRRIFPERQNTAAPRSHDVRHHLDDFEVLEKARASGTGREFEALYDRGNAAGGDHSRTDNKLMMMLAFWCGKDAGQMERLFSGSALGQRDKWTRRPDYRRRTIERACNATSKVYNPRHGKLTETTREDLRHRMTYALSDHQWREKAGRADAAATDYFAYRAMLRTAYKANRTTVGMSERELAEEAGLGARQTASDSLRRLEDKHGLLAKVADGGKDGAATYRLNPVIPKVVQTLISKDAGKDTPTSQTCVYSMSALLLGGTPGLRNPTPDKPDHDRNRRRIPKGEQVEVKRLGKVCAWILDMVYAARTAVPISFLSERTGIAQNHLPERYMKKLIVAGLIKQTEEGYMATTNVKEVLAEELEVSGCNDAAGLQKERHDREREAYRTRKAEKAPTEEEMDALREQRGVEIPTIHVEDFEDFAQELERLEKEMEEPALSDLAVAVRDHLDRFPRDADESPSWIANTLWAYELYPGKPTRHEVRDAMVELGLKPGYLKAVT